MQRVYSSSAACSNAICLVTGTSIVATCKRIGRTTKTPRATPRRKRRPSGQLGQWLRMRARMLPVRARPERPPFSSEWAAFFVVADRSIASLLVVVGLGVHSAL
jgi:hypothetical protein